MSEFSAKTVDGSLPEHRSGFVLDEKCGRLQRQKMVRWIDLSERRGFSNTFARYRRTSLERSNPPGPADEEWMLRRKRASQ